ncbi:unnamed protein product [Cuscuta campestris]|uniref:Uncharacterized protein n=1 Tax=Cuscuta campestris TaxID=132261 RepID=A0A484L7G4_9ASTE|nr:unnamed protein product [Cuscuta campestris]
MEQGTTSNSVPQDDPIDKSKILDIKPMRSLIPVFPSANGMSSAATPQPSPFTCVPPVGPFPPGVAPFYPFLAPNDSSRRTEQPPSGYTQPISPVPLNSFRTPMSNGDSGRPRRSSGIVAEDDEYSDQSDQYGYGFHDNSVEDSSTKKRKGRPRKKTKMRGHQGKPPVEVDYESILQGFLESFKLTEVESSKKADGDKDLVGRILLAYDLFRRKMSQIQEMSDPSPGSARRPDLKAGTMLMTKGIRTNQTKRVGNVPGIEVGDIFFFRMELCVVGLHAPTMAGIDYMNYKLSADDEPISVSIVSSGGYDDEGDDGEVLIYSGQGGVQRRDGQMFDQKLERGNLALEKSLHRANEVRVIRGVKDPWTTGKIYLYDGLYKIQESWAEKNTSGCNVFKYKLVRIPGQPEAYVLWKLIQQWKDGISTRAGVILPDLTSGAESQPVSLVNDVDNEKGPAYFTYISTLKNPKSYETPSPSLSCHCIGGCQPGNSNCPCIQRNRGYLPYNALGVLMTYNNMILECCSSCPCPSNCRNRMSQAGLKVRLEVFKTKNRGWGLRSWDPIRGGCFICEYAGEVIDADDIGSYREDNYIFDASRHYPTLEDLHAENGNSAKIPFPLVISAKNNGNVARFMNHSCSPNVFWQPVVRGSNSEAYYHIAFFATRHIPPMQELTFDYGMVWSDKAVQMRKKCLCGSLNCRGYFY